MGKSGPQKPRTSIPHEQCDDSAVYNKFSYLCAIIHKHSLVSSPKLQYINPTKTSALPVFSSSIYLIKPLLP